MQSRAPIMGKISVSLTLYTFLILCVLRPILCLAEGGLDCLFLVSGGSDKQVRVWNQSLQPISLLDISSYSYVDASISAIDVRPSSGAGILQLLVGTGGGDIMEVSSKPSDGDNEQAKGKKVEDQPQNLPADLDLSKAKIEVFVNSHVKGELWGLATHPIDADLIATAGDDGTLRIWSMKRKAMLKCLDLQWPARSLAWHPLGAVIAVGFHESVKGGHKGGRKGKQKKGKKKGKYNSRLAFSSCQNQLPLLFRRSRRIIITQGCNSLVYIQDSQQLWHC